MKTSEDIYDDFKKWLYQTNSDKFIEYKNKKWYSKEEIKEAIVEVKKWEHHNLSKDWEIELQNKLFNNKV